MFNLWLIYFYFFW